MRLVAIAVTLLVNARALPAAAQSTAHCQLDDSWRPSVTLLAGVDDTKAGRVVIARACAKLDALRRCYDAKPPPATTKVAPPKKTKAARRADEDEPQRSGELLLHEQKRGTERIEWRNSTLRATETACVSKLLAQVALPAPAAGEDGYRFQITFGVPEEPLWSETGGTASCDHAQTWQPVALIRVDVPTNQTAARAISARACERLVAFRTCATASADQPPQGEAADLILRPAAAGGVAKVDVTGESALAPSVLKCVVSAARGIALPKGSPLTRLVVELTATTPLDTYQLDPVYKPAGISDRP